MASNKSFIVQLSRAPGLGPREALAIASTGAVDMLGDIVEPGGCVTRGGSVILLANHDPEKPIGRASISSDGRSVTAEITFANEGISKIADEFCSLLKTGVLTDVSIGFDPIEQTPIKGGGWRYTKWKLLELSVVSIGANPEAIVTQRAGRSGRVISGANAAILQTAHDAAEAARSGIAEVLKSADSATTSDDLLNGDGTERRRRSATALELRHVPASAEQTRRRRIVAALRHGAGA